MADNRWATLFASGAPSPSGLRDELLQSTELVLPTAAAVADTNLAGSRAIKVAGVSYFYDATDTTSAHDGVAVMVSADGRRYKPGYPQRIPQRCETYGNTPPGSPLLGRAYLIGAAPSGAWASHADEIGVWTVNGWAFIDPASVPGVMVYVADEDATYQLADDGWRKGIGPSALSAGMVEPYHLHPDIARVWSVESQSTNAPPAGVEGITYVVGPSPTGAWAGQAGKIAYYRTGWEFFSPAEGWQIWDKDQNQQFFFDGTSWVSPAQQTAAIPRIATSYVPNAGSLGVVGPSNATVPPAQYSYSDSSPPTTSGRRIMYNFLDLIFAASGPSKKLVFEWDGINLPAFDQSAGYAVTLAIFRDAEAAAILWCDPNKFSGRMIGLSPDAGVHTYRLAMMVREPVATALATLKNMSFSVMEVAA